MSGSTPAPRLLDPRLNLTYGVNDEVGKQQHQQQAEPDHEAADPPDLLPSAPRWRYPGHVLVDLTPGDDLQLLVQFVELGEMGAVRLLPGLAQILQAVQPGQRGLGIPIDLGIRYGLLMGAEQFPITGQLLLIAGQDALVPSTA